MPCSLGRRTQLHRHFRHGIDPTQPDQPAFHISVNKQRGVVVISCLATLQKHFLKIPVASNNLRHSQITVRSATLAEYLTAVFEQMPTGFL
mmetsp:Transcript_17429/g.52258  ORF Transcript_17429/g.52258 Transcript_17429/m.52258 type:complete len:91 (+) Transcript_17429:3275-3547(+)